MAPPGLDPSAPWLPEFPNTPRTPELPDVVEVDATSIEAELPDRLPEI